MSLNVSPVQALHLQSPDSDSRWSKSHHSRGQLVIKKRPKQALSIEKSGKNDSIQGTNGAAMRLADHRESAQCTENLGLPAVACKLQ